MAKFRKKPIIVEAEQFFNMENERPHGVFSDYNCTDAVWRGAGGTCEFVGPHVHTLHGPQLVEHGDWVIHGSKSGDVYACRPDVFAATYEPVDA